MNSTTAVAERESTTSDLGTEGHGRTAAWMDRSDGARSAPITAFWQLGTCTIRGTRHADAIIVRCLIAGRAVATSDEGGVLEAEAHDAKPASDLAAAQCPQLHLATRIPSQPPTRPSNDPQSKAERSLRSRRVGYKQCIPA